MSHMRGAGYKLRDSSQYDCVQITASVDETSYTFLRAIDKGLLPLSFTAENGETVDLVKEGGGDLAEQYIRPGGWRDQFSKQRIGAD